MKALDAISKHFVTSIKRIGLDNMPVLVRKGDRNDLAECFAELKFNRGVEIGVQRGHYSVRLCQANPKLHLTCVDPWEAVGTMKQEVQEGLFQKTTKRLSRYNVSIKRMPSMRALHLFKDNELDFVYIDGAHDFDNVMMDLIQWAYKVKRGGIIALHDYMAGFNAGVMQAVNAYTHCHSIRPWFVTREALPTAFWVHDDDYPIRRYTKIVRPQI